MGANDAPKLAIEEALERLEGMAAFVTAVIGGASRDDLAFRPGEGAGDFSLREHACHLRDLEREGYLVRARRILSEPTPELAAFDGAAVAAARDYPRQDAREAARDFAAARAELVAMLRAATGAELERDALFEGRRITLAGLVAMVSEHDRGHREEIQELLDALEAP